MTKKDSALKNMQKSYRLALQNEAGKDVMADLRILCNATKTTFTDDRDMMLINEGRRQVFLHIMSMLKVDIEDVYSMEYDEWELN